MLLRQTLRRKITISVNLVVVGTSPAHDVSVVVGPFRSEQTAKTASEDLTAKGYNTEVCPLQRLADVESSVGWDEEMSL